MFKLLVLLFIIKLYAGPIYTNKRSKQSYFTILFRERKTLGRKKI